MKVLNPIIGLYDTDLNILVTEPKGDITAEVLIKYYNSLPKRRDIPRKLKVLVIGTDCRVLTEPKELDYIVDAVNESTSHFESIKEALILDGPYATVIGTLWSERIKSINYNAKVFSTKNAALQWLLE